MDFSLLHALLRHHARVQFRGARLGRLLFIVALLATPVAAEIVRTPAAITIGPATIPLQIFTEPGAGTGPITAMVNQAQHTVDMSVYLITHPDVLAALAHAEVRGVEVRVMSEEEPFGAGRNFFLNLKKALEPGGVEVKDGPTRFGYAHAKYLVVDRRMAMIATANFTKSGLGSSREFLIVDRDPSDVGTLAAIFDADWHDRRARASDPELVVSPDSSRVKIEGLLHTATQSVAIIMEVFTDKQIRDALVQLARAGVKVRVLLPPLKELTANTDIAHALRAAGVEVRTRARPFPHAKAVVVDGRAAYIGSVNFTPQSFDDNREIGLLTIDAKTINTVLSTFERDWNGAIIL